MTSSSSWLPLESLPAKPIQPAMPPYSLSKEWSSHHASQWLCSRLLSQQVQHHLCFSPLSLLCAKRMGTNGLASFQSCIWNASPPRLLPISNLPTEGPQMSWWLSPLVATRHCQVEEAPNHSLGILHWQRADQWMTPPQRNLPTCPANQAWHPHVPKKNTLHIIMLPRNSWYFSYRRCCALALPNSAVAAKQPKWLLAAK